MSRRNGILTVLLAAQIVLIAILIWPRSSAATAGKLYPDFDIKSASSITVTDKARTLTMAKKDGVWVLPGAGDFPVNEVRVSELLTKVAQIDTRRLVASNASSHNRLEVGDDAFLRKVEITAAGKPITLLMGSAPNARATHVRSKESDNVYLTSALSAADVRSDVGNWIDTVYLQINDDDLITLRLANANGHFDLDRGAGGEWEIAGLVEGETTNQANVTSVVNRLTTLNMLEPLGKEPAPEWGMATPASTITFTVQPTTTLPAQTIVLTIGDKLADGSGYPVKASTSDYYVKVAGFTLDNLIANQRSDFVTPPIASPVTPPLTPPPTDALSITTTAPATITFPFTNTQQP